MCDSENWFEYHIYPDSYRILADTIIPARPVSFGIDINLLYLVYTLDVVIC